MAKQNYGYAKRQRELAKKKKKEEKRRRKEAKKVDGEPVENEAPAPENSGEEE
jgi:hypothetical protein